MKATQLSVKMFLDELDALETRAEKARSAAKAWLNIQHDRSNGWPVSSDEAWSVRANLEEALTEYREQLAAVYDFMGDKGLVNFVPTWPDQEGIAIHDERL